MNADFYKSVFALKGKVIVKNLLVHPLILPFMQGNFAPSCTNEFFLFYVLDK